LQPVFRSATGTVYELPDPTPLLTGAGEASLTHFGHDRVEGRVDAPGVYRLAVRYTPYWVVDRGGVCLEEASDGMTLLQVSAAGAFSLSVDEDPLSLTGRLVDGSDGSCP
jgi:hypothetical protein